MAKFNCIIAVLAEQDKIRKWLADQTSKCACTISMWRSYNTKPALKNLGHIVPVLFVKVKDLLNDTYFVYKTFDVCHGLAKQLNTTGRS